MEAQPVRETGRHLCPFCDEELMAANFPYCRVCGITVFYCPNCRRPVPREELVCPQCSADLRAEASSMDG